MDAVFGRQPWDPDSTDDTEHGAGALGVEPSKLFGYHALGTIPFIIHWEIYY